MKRSHLGTLAVALAAFAGAQAATADASAPKTRAQVKAELAEAMRTGDIPVGGDQNVKLNELFPGIYPPKPVVPVSSRAQVKAELDEAVRTGDIPVGGDRNAKLNEVFPSLYGCIR